jgi:hypothetical protein
MSPIWKLSRKDAGRRIALRLRRAVADAPSRSDKPDSAIPARHRCNHAITGSSLRSSPRQLTSVGRSLGLKRRPRLSLPPIPLRARIRGYTLVMGRQFGPERLLPDTIRRPDIRADGLTFPADAWVRMSSSASPASHCLSPRRTTTG